MDKVVSGIIITFLAALVIFLMGLRIGANKQKDMDMIKLEVKVNSLEERVTTFETLYREHLEECSFISKNNIKVGYNNYLQKID